MMALPPVLRGAQITEFKYQWPMFARVNAVVEYEVRSGAADEEQTWQAVDLEHLGWWDRGRHHGTAVLIKLCQPATENADEPTAARRVVNGEVRAEVSCSTAP